MRPFRELLPARLHAEKNSESAEEAEGAAPTTSSSSSSNARKRPQTRIACDPCRRKKSKCDGRRPVCSTCATAGLHECDYDGEPDLTRTAALKKKYEQLQHRLELFEELFRLLSLRSDDESVEIIRRMRTANLDSDLEDLVRFIKDGDMLMQLSAAGAGREVEHALPSAEFPHAGASEDVASLLVTLNLSVSKLDAPSRAAFLEVVRTQIDELAATEARNIDVDAVDNEARGGSGTK